MRSKSTCLVREWAEQRSVPYQGPETAVDLLKRVGGVTAGAAPDEVYVVRSRIAEGKQPEVFHVKLRDILTKHDESTNIRLQPQDQIYVGETNRSALSRYMPPWLKPMFDAVWGMARPEKPTAELTFFGQPTRHLFAALGVQASSDLAWPGNPRL